VLLRAVLLLALTLEPSIGAQSIRRLRRRSIMTASTTASSRRVRPCGTGTVGAGSN
jgi:hypothetical protein